MNPVGLLSLAVCGASPSTTFAYRRFLDDGSLAVEVGPSIRAGRRETLPPALRAFAVRTAGARTTSIRA